jgi:DNA-binding beta-propeller fold protein YncE
MDREERDMGVGTKAGTEGSATTTRLRGRVANRHHANLLMLLCAGAFLALTLVPASAAALDSTSPQLWKTCSLGSDAGQCSIPNGMASSPTTGDVYVADLLNFRVDQFTAWGEFVRAWGWGVDDGKAEPQVCTTQSGCQGGLQGVGAGTLGNPQGIAVDSEGNVYVAESASRRVQKFDSKGNFLLMFGGEVDKGPNHPGNVCTAAYLAEGDACGAGTSGTGDGQFAFEAVGAFIAIGSADQVYVGDSERIQVFDADGAYQSQLPIPQPGFVDSLAVDPVSGDLYMAYYNHTTGSEKARPNVYRLDPSSGALLDTLEVERPDALATDAAGDVYVFEESHSVGKTGDPANHSSRVLEFDPSGKQVGVVGEVQYASKNELENAQLATSSACFGDGTGDLYVDYSASFTPSHGGNAEAVGPPPTDTKLCPPPSVAPSVDAQYASSVGTEEATLQAKINPHFWVGGTGATVYYLQYATAACIEEGGWEAACVSETPAPPGTELQGGIVSEDLTTAGIFLTGLSPATAYRYRFVAESGGAPGKPVFGAGGKPGEDGKAATFTTFPAPAGANEGCENQAFRTGPSAKLPDCRAYELVSPLDKAGGDVTAPLNIAGWPARMDQASTSGEAFSYSSYRPFAGVVSGSFVNQYLARRDPEAGWQTQPISPPQEGKAFTSPLIPVDNLFKAFSADLGSGWLLTDTEPVLGPGGLAGHANLYRRDNETGTYEACTAAEPEFPEPAHPPQLQGVSADQGIAIFRVENKLTENATALKTYQLYACSFGEGEAAQVRLVSVLPDGSASKLQNTGGGPANLLYEYSQGRSETLTNAVSSDGSRIFWTASTINAAAGPGSLYVRLNPSQPESAHLHGTASGTGSLVGPASATGHLINTSTTISEVKVKSGTFSVGQSIAGAGIAPGTTIIAVEPEKEKLKISKPATATVVAGELTGAASEVVSNAIAESGAFAVGQEVFGPGIPGGTTIVALQESSPGVFKLTLSAKATQSGTGALAATSACTEASKACTYPVSRGNSARFLTASTDGETAIYFEEGLHSFDVAGRKDTLVAGSGSVLGASDDARRVYFASKEVLDGGAVAGKPNLYLYEAGEPAGYTFIATLSEGDVEQDTFRPSSTNPSPAIHLARVSPSGLTAAFTSNEPALAEAVAGYDNIDRASGEPDDEIYRYDAATGQLACVSCNPSGARPIAQEPSGEVKGEPDVRWTAARIAPWLNTLYGPRVLSEDGARIFFEAFEPLVLSDTNGKVDVYEWEQAGVGDCEDGSTAYVEASGGCLVLISSGKSPADSEFVDASPDGHDVFIRTAESLLNWDPGQIDIYDARVDGGFPPPPGLPPGCEGEACQGSPEAPNDPTPASSTFEGAGNVQGEATKPAPRCAKGKVKRHGKCVAKKHKKPARHRRAHRNRGAGR